MLRNQSILGLFVFVAGANAASAQDDIQSSNLSFFSAISTQTAIFERDDGRESGVQIVTPIEFGVRFERGYLGLKTAHIYSERDSDFAGGSGTVSTLSDTVLSGSYQVYAGAPEWLGERRITFAINGDLNIPTGQEQLAGSEKNAVFDSFLVDQDRFGEGWNIGSGFSSTVGITQNTLLGIGASYISRGDYNPDGDAPNRTLSPGDHLVGTVQLLHASEAFRGSVGYRLIEERETEVDRVAIYDRAISHEVFASVSVPFAERWMASASGHYATRGADKALDIATGTLRRTVRDDNGDTYQIAGSLSYAFNPFSSVTARASYRHRGENDFDEADFAFAPSLSRLEVGLEYNHRLESGVRLAANASYFEVEEGSILGFSGPRFQGASFGLETSYAF